MNGLKRCLLVNIDVHDIKVAADAPMENNLGCSRQATKDIIGYTLVINSQSWRQLHGQFVEKLDPFN